MFTLPHFVLALVPLLCIPTCNLWNGNVSCACWVFNVFICTGTQAKGLPYILEGTLDLDSCRWTKCLLHKRIALIFLEGWGRMLWLVFGCTPKPSCSYGQDFIILSEVAGSGV